MAPEREVGVDAILERGEPQLLQSGDLARGERLAVKLGQRRPAPERQRIAQPRRPLAGVVASARIGDQRLEPGHVDLTGRDLQ